MTPPRWFFPLLAACAVVLTLAGAYALVARADVGRYRVIRTNIGAAHQGMLDSRTGRLCTLDRAVCLGEPDDPGGLMRAYDRAVADTAKP